MKIAIEHVIKHFDTFTALDDVSLDISSGELIALLGPSGSGKTTLLRIIAGLEWPDGGAVRFDGEDTVNRRVGDRHVGFVFQHYALFRHMTIFENVAFGLRARPRSQRLSEKQIQEKVGDLLNLVQLHWLANRYPTQLSGGQRQRIALARALAVEPRVLLLDEPFGALDAKVRKQLRRWLRHLHEKIQVTSIFVTHDQEEALEIADRVVVLDKGKIAQVGTPRQVYEQPENAFVHGFIGDSISLPVVIEDGQVCFEKNSLGLNRQGVPDGQATLFARPYDVTLSPDASEGALPGLITRVYGLGAARRAEVAVTTEQGEHLIEIALPRDLALRAGQSVGLAAKVYRLFPRQGPLEQLDIVG